MDNTDTIDCPKCAQKLNVPTDKGTLTVTCPSCRASWEWPPVANFIDEEVLAGNPRTPGMESKQEERPKFDKLVIPCPHCSEKLFIPRGLNVSIRLTCPACRKVWWYPKIENPVQEAAAEQIAGSIFGSSGGGFFFLRGQCEKCQSRGDFYLNIEHHKCPHCRADCDEMFHKQFHERFADLFTNVEGADDDREMVSFATFKPTDLTPIGWTLFFSCYTFMVSLLFLAIVVLGKEIAQRIGFKLLFVVFAFLPFGFGIMLFYAGKWLLEKKLNVRVVKATPSEAANWHDPDVAHNVVIALGILVPVAVFFYIQVFME